MNRGTRIVLGIILTISMLLAGLIIGAWVGGTFLVSKGSGLAGGAEVFFYGLIGGVIAGVLGFVLSRKLNGKPLVWTTILLGPVGLAVAILMIRGYSQSQSEMEAHLQEAYKNLPVFNVVVDHPDNADFQRMEVDWATQRYTAAVNNVTCTAQISGKEAVAMLTALREADLVLYRNANPCNGANPSHRLTYTITEGKPPHSQGDVAFGTDCIALHPQLEKPFIAAAKLLISGDMPKSCQ